MRLQPRAHNAEGSSHPTFDRAERTLEADSDIAVTQVFIKGKSQTLALLPRKQTEQLSHGIGRSPCMRLSTGCRSGECRLATSSSSSIELLSSIPPAGRVHPRIEGNGFFDRRSCASKYDMRGWVTGGKRSWPKHAAPCCARSGKRRPCCTRTRTLSQLQHRTLVPGAVPAPALMAQALHTKDFVAENPASGAPAAAIAAISDMPIEGPGH